MANFGGVIKLGGVAEYRLALANVSQKLRETSSELQAISSEFAASDRSEQSQISTLKQLNNVLSEQKASYEKLKNTYNNMLSVYKTNESNLSKLNVQYVTEKGKLDEIKRTLGTTSDAYKNQENVVSKLKKEVSNATLAQESNNTQLSKVKTKLYEAEAAYQKTSKEVEDFSKSIKDSDDKAKNASNGGYSVLKNTVANLLSNAFSRVTGLITGSFSSAIERVDNIRAFGVTLKNLGFSAEDVTTSTQKLVDGIQGLPTSLPNVMQIQKQFLALSGSVEDSTALTLALNDATLAGGQGQEVANSALTQWYQIIANGKPDMQSWRIINQAMPAQLNQIAESIMGVGYKSDDLYQAWQKGTVTTEQVTEALKKLDKEGTGAVQSFAEQAKGASGGIATSWGNVKLAITNGLANLIESIGSDKISAALDQVKNVVKSAFEGAKVALDFLLQHGNEIAGILGAIGAVLVPLLVITKIGKAVKDFGEAIGALKSAISLLKGEFVKLTATMMAHPFVAISAAIAALVSAFIYLWNNCEGFRNFFINLWENIKNAVGVAVKAISDFFVGMWNGIVATFNGFVAFFQGLWDGVVNVFSVVGEWFSGVFSAAWNGITRAFSSAGSFFSRTWETIKNAFSSVGNWFSNIFSAAWSGITNIFSRAGNFFSGVWNAITSAFSSVGGWFGRIFSSAWDGIARAFSSVGSFFSNIFNQITSPFSNIIGFFSNLSGRMWEATVNLGKNIIQGVWAGIKGAMDWLFGLLGGLGQGVLNTVKGFFGINSPSKLMRDEVGKNLALGIGEGFSSEMKTVTSDIQDSLPTSFDINSAQVKSAGTYYSAENNYMATVNAFKEALSDMVIELDNENVGSFVRRTVTKAIYA